MSSGRMAIDTAVVDRLRFEDKGMNQAIVERLEIKIEDAIAEVVTGMGGKKLPLMPLHCTMHLTAKAAVTVYEAAVENQHSVESP